MDPAKAPALQGEIWTLIQSAQLHLDLGLEERPGDDAFDEFVMHVDGWLCEIKDVQIRDGLHVLGQAPDGDDLVNLVLAILRSNQVFGGQVNGVPGLRRRALGPRAVDVTDRRGGPARGRGQGRLVDGAGRAGWDRRRGLRRSHRRAGDAGRRGVGRVADVRLHRGGAAAAAHQPTRSPRCCTPWTAATSRPDRPVRPCGAW